MGRLIVITTPQEAPGFRLGGVAVEAAASAADAERILREVVAAGEEGVVAVHEPYLAELPPRTRARLEEALSPVVVALPAGTAGEGASRRARLAAMLRRSVGYRITFGSEEA